MDPLQRIDAYTLLDLHAGIETDNGHWRLMAYGKNVTNRYYWTSTHSTQSFAMLVGRPRMVSRSITDIDETKGALT
jgi:outer membrane receptor protein involved in Fe transport